MRGVLALLLLATLPLPWPSAAAEAGEVVRWSGEVVLTEPFVVLAGQTLLVEPGTTVRSGALLHQSRDHPERVTGTRGYVHVHGRMEVLGNVEAPVDWRVNLTVFPGGEALVRGTAFDATDFDGCAVQSDGNITLESSRFTNNSNTLCIGGGQAELRGSTFRYNGFIESTPDVLACDPVSSDSFGETGTAAMQCPRHDLGSQGPPGAQGRCWQSWRGDMLCRGFGGTIGTVYIEQAEVLLEGNHFEDNYIAVTASTNANVVFRNNTLVDNDRGFDSGTWIGGPARVLRITGNRFEHHGTRMPPYFLHEDSPSGLAIGTFGGANHAPRHLDAIVADNHFRRNFVGLYLGGDVAGVQLWNNTFEEDAVGVANQWGRATMTGGSIRSVHLDLWLWGGHGNLELRNVNFDPAKVRVEGEAFVEHEGGIIRQATLAGAIIAAMAAVLYALTEAGRWLLLKGLLGLGYTRMRVEEVAGQARREALLRHLAAHPGAHLRDLAGIAGSYGNAVYHLTLLERQGLLRSARDGVRRRFYPAGPAPADSPLSPQARRLHALLQEPPGMTLSEAARALGCSRQLAAYHARVLQDRGLLGATGEGRGRVLRAVRPAPGESADWGRG